MLALALGCHEPPPERPAPPVALGGVLTVGCSEWVAADEGWACELEPSVDEPASLRVWVPPGPPPRVLVDGDEHPPTRVRELDGGVLLDVALPQDAAELAVERIARSAQDPWGTRPVRDAPAQPVERWALTLRWRDPEREPLPLDAAKVAMFTAFAEERWQDCQREAAKVRMRARETGRGLTELRALQNGILCSIERGDAEAARALAFDLEELPATDDEREVTRAYVSGLVLLGQGALHESIVALRKGLRLSERLGMTTRHAEHLSMLSLALAELGDVDGAVAAATAALDRQAHPYVHPCEEAALRTNLAWVSMLGAEVGLAERVPDPQAELERALEAFEGPRAVCAHEEAAANVGLNLARAAMLRHDPSETERWLARVDDPIARAGNRHLQAELRLVRAQWLLAVGRVEQARTALGATAQADALPHGLRLQQWVLQGELAERDGDLARAQALYRRAHVLPLERVGLLAHDEGRLRFLYDRLRGSQHLVALLAGPGGDAAGALQVAREAAGREARLLAARHRVLHGPAVDPALEATRLRYLAVRDHVERLLEERWDLRPEARRDLRDRARPHERARLDVLLGVAPEPTASEVLRPPGPGELLLHYFPMPSGRRLGFAATVDGVRVVELGAPPMPLAPAAASDPEAWRRAWAEHLLVPLAEAVDEAERIRVLPSFGLESLPFHALPWRGRPLLAHAAVEHAVDLPDAGSTRSEATRSAGPVRALVVGDPQGDLADARVEAEAVVRVLERRGLPVEALLGSDASGMAVRAALPRAELLHYAGHAAVAGPFGWESTLGLAEYGRLEVGDLFALDRVPGQVVLTACRGGAQAIGPRERGMSLAEAFVIAGAFAVVAASIDLDAAEVSSLGALVHEAHERGRPPELALAFRRAMLRWHEATGTTATWQALRLWVP